MQPHTDPKDKQHQAADPAPQSADQWQDHLAKLSQYGEQLYQDYRQQAGICKELASAEWRLSTRSLALTIILLVSFAGGLVLLWAGLLITLGFAVFAFSQSIWLSAVCLIGLQLLCLMWLWKNIGYISSKIGFDKTAHSIKQLLNINRGE
ncbi:hypothetical protein H5154_08740 [Pseudoalteromonas sp. SR44-5]|uniref:Phage holin family protein n=2 Tax=Pseudoalteromonas TaxID=53246 RepID=A0ABY3FFL0_9GAMM|nr:MULTISPECIES: hypothetical protein [Pseudoalteromonas]MBB1333372.1 hypothetical protein [Pseudoalteromonas sp. SR41-6]MBB1341262.1 hypothetical protein [Pseudoalteromonas sp. SR45-6]MBB1366465.1 hypothetical protein [Pseudoalteromonas sp. SR44-5]MBB1417226.1 hypothetical protein [Pseudoalteromonas sp. SG44-1]MBB1423522.1 hypothetical protein [Pseudoalteromonas sp. SG43-7]